MPKVGRFVTDPRAGAHCRVTLDSGEKIIVHHEKGGFGGGMLTIEVSKFMGFASDRLFACNLDSPHGTAVLAWLTPGCRARYPRRHPAGICGRVRQGSRNIRRAEGAVRGADGEALVRVII